MPTLDVVARLQGRRVLVVEDDVLQALDLEEQLQAAGAIVVGPVPRLKDATFLLVIAPRLDVAVLDINLGGELVYPLADQLMAMHVPIVFATAYPQQDIPARFGAVPYCEKPIAVSRVALALSMVVEAV